jgi:hypothetical protein
VRTGIGVSYVLFDVGLGPFELDLSGHQRVDLVS